MWDVMRVLADGTIAETLCSNECAFHATGSDSIRAIFPEILVNESFKSLDIALSMKTGQVLYYCLNSPKQRFMEAQFLPALNRSDLLLVCREISEYEYDSKVITNGAHKLLGEREEGICLVDANMVATYANSNFCTELGYLPEDIPGHRVTEFVAEEYSTKLSENFKNGNIKNGQSVVPFIHKQGHRIWNVVAWSHFGASDLFHSLVVISRIGNKQSDIPGFHDNEVAINEIMQKLQQLKLKSTRHSPETLRRAGNNLSPLSRIDSYETVVRNMNNAMNGVSREERSLLETCEEGFWMITTEGVTTYSNAKMAEMLGYSSKEMIGRHLFEFMDDDMKEYARLNLNKRQNGISEQHDFRFTKKNGEYMWALVTTNPVSENGKIIGAIAMVKDITDRYQRELQITKLAQQLSNQLEYQTKQAQEKELERQRACAADEAKSIFLANMSHEVRTPLNGIIGASQLLNMTSLNAEQRGYLDMIHSSSENLLVLINDVLDFSKLEVDRLVFDIKIFDLYTLVTESLSLFAISAQSKGVTLKQSIGKEVPHYIRGDPARLKQILINLIGNAVKFSNSGTVELEVTYCTKSAEELKLYVPDAKMTSNFDSMKSEPSVPILISVKDTGIGIPDDKLPNLFQRFYQVDPSITKQYGGTGLGLAISKLLIERMGGRIGVQSKLGAGSCFMLLIHPPIVHCIPDTILQEQTATPETPRRSNGTTTYNILLAEDNVVNQRVVAKILEKLGFIVDIVTTGKEALEAITTMNNRLLKGDTSYFYSSVLMDWRMPEMDGLTATKLIRKLVGPACHIPIVTLTAHSMSGDKEQCLAAGADAYLSKPINPQQLKQTIHHWTFIGYEKIMSTCRSSSSL